MIAATQQSVGAEQVLEGLYEWIKANPWFVADKGQFDALAGLQAQEGMLMLARGETAAYRALPARARNTAVMLTIDFLAKLAGPLRGKTWQVSSEASALPALQAAAWRVVEFEVLRNSDPSATRH